jgi:hypothetical protein
MNSAEGPILRDIHLPPAPGWWPPAPGWWLLAGIGVALCILIAIRLRKRARVQRWRRAVMHEFDALVATARADPAVLAASLSQFLRRLAVRHAPAAVAYSGERWLEFLDQQSSDAQFRSGVGRVLIEAPYRAHMDYDAVALIALVRRWVRAKLDADRVHA